MSWAIRAAGAHFQRFTCHFGWPLLHCAICACPPIRHCIGVTDWAEYVRWTSLQVLASARRQTDRTSTIIFSTFLKVGRCSAAEIFLYAVFLVARARRLGGSFSFRESELQKLTILQNRPIAGFYVLRQAVSPASRLFFAPPRDTSSSCAITSQDLSRNGM